MRKILTAWLAIAFCSAAVLAATVARAQETAEGDGYAYGLCKTWNLATDYASATDNSQPIYPDACGRSVWYLYDSASQSYDPAAYRLLDSFISATSYCTPGSDIKSWSSSVMGAPHISVDALGVDRDCDPWAPITWLANSAIVHPSWVSAAVVGWKSPVGGHVSVSASFTDIDLWCGDGVNWFVQKNGLTLASGLTDGDATSIWKSDKLKIEAGDVLHFGVGPGPSGDYYCDTTRLEITVEHP